jgi:hypothetical protein
MTCTYCSQGRRDSGRNAQKGHVQGKIVNKVTSESDSNSDLELHLMLKACCAVLLLDNSKVMCKKDTLTAQCNAVHYCNMQCNTAQCTSVQCSAIQLVQCSIAQYSAVRCSTVQYSSSLYLWDILAQLPPSLL